MTPERALAILEGKIPHRELPKSTLDEKKTLPAIKEEEFKELEFTEDVAPVNIDKPNDFMRILVIILILGVLIFAYLWRFAVVSKDSYKTGFNDGVASIGSNLTLAQEDNSNKLQEINQLQQEIDKTMYNLESMTQQKDQLAQSLKETQESLPSKISIVEQPLQEKIKRLTEESQKKISDLSNQLSSAERDISGQEKQLSGLQKMVVQSKQERDIAQNAATGREQQLAAAQKDLSDKIKQINQLEQEITKARKEAP
jgi:hypothetical protein